MGGNKKYLNMHRVSANDQWKCYLSVIPVQLMWQGDERDVHQRASICHFGWKTKENFKIFQVFQDFYRPCGAFLTGLRKRFSKINKGHFYIFISLLCNTITVLIWLLVPPRRKASLDRLFCDSSHLLICISKDEFVSWSMTFWSLFFFK